MRQFFDGWQVPEAWRRAWSLPVLTTCLWVVLSMPISAADKGTGTFRSKAIQKLSRQIDERIEARLNSEGVAASPVADDAEYLRRVWLHLAGTIPPVSEVRRFLDDASPDKRARAADNLLSRPSFVREFTTFWRKAWLPEAETDAMVQARVPAVEAWLRQQLLQDRPYDDIVRDLLSVPIAANTVSAASRTADDDTGPVAFLLAKEGKPEALAASASRAFLGVRLDCAQCHDHPFDRWKRDQFWSFAAFFAGLERGDSNQPTRPNFLREAPDRRELMIPETQQLVSAVFLDGSEPKWRSHSGRQVLAEWITSPRNAFFAKAAVNRLWGHLFGVGLVDPVDDFSSANAASHPELLDDLAAAFVASDYDARFMLRAIIGSQAYQRTSRHESPDTPPQLLAYLSVQGMTAEQLVRSLSQVVNLETQPANGPQPVIQPGELAAMFSRPGETPTQRQTTILQALILMNGRTTATAIDLQNGTLLAAVIDFPGTTTEEKIEALFLATLSRFPSRPELSRFAGFVAEQEDSSTALGDILWALLNSTEFASIH